MPSGDPWAEPEALLLESNTSPSVVGSNREAEGEDGGGEVGMAAFSSDAKGPESAVADAATETGGSLWEAGKNWEDREGETAAWKSRPPEASTPTPEAERGPAPESSPKVGEPRAEVGRGS